MAIETPDNSEPSQEKEPEHFLIVTYDPATKNTAWAVKGQIPLDTLYTALAGIQFDLLARQKSGTMAAQARKVFRAAGPLPPFRG